jgi:glycosyltransferase involved in cell wall biosynthesis
LTFGYNTGIFNVLMRMKGVPNVINMDGLEWSRKRWGLFRQAILYINERFAAKAGNELIADHPEINTYLRSRAPARKITTITYGAYKKVDTPREPVTALGLEPDRYLTLIARPIPENSILELVKAFSAKKRGVRLAILGDYNRGLDRYQRDVMEAASDEVEFLGPIYDPVIVRALRQYSLGYLHGHTVGGTNPSLVEALAVGNPVIAHDNKYNTWVADDAAIYFSTSADAEVCIDRILEDKTLSTRLSSNALQRFESEFTWDQIGGQYEMVLRKWHETLLKKTDRGMNAQW